MGLLLCIMHSCNAMRVLRLASNLLHVRYGQQSSAANLLNDVCSFIVFLIYPTASATTFKFFMTEVYNGPGEDPVRAPHSLLHATT
jgi:hypothetical protein